MISPRLLTASFILLIACSAKLYAAPLNYTRFTGHQLTINNSQFSAPLSLTLKDGRLQVRTPAGIALTEMRLRLRLGDGSLFAGDLQPAGQDKATDQAGAYERFQYRMNTNAPGQPSQAGTVNAMLELRHYLRPDVIVASLEYAGPNLAPISGIQVLMRLESFARGLAIKRLKLYWTAPVFTSDYRLLPASNQLLLWRQMQGDNYHLLVPLAGGGMIGELGVEGIEDRYEFRVASSSYDPSLSPRHVPLFAYAASNDPYRLPNDTYKAAFAASDQYGRLRWEKGYPEVFRWLGWCSWNTYYHAVSEEKVLNSIRSLHDRHVPVGFVLVDDGWLTINNDKLAGFDADSRKFPRGLAGLAKTLREQYHIPHVGIWHTFQGYWSGVDQNSEIGRTHKLFNGVAGRDLPDPRDGGGEGFYADWYSHLAEWGIDFIKVDNQASNGRFTNGLLPLFTSGAGEQRNLQEAAQKHFSEMVAGEPRVPSGLSVINCMAMSLENAFNWRLSNIARNSDDYLPDSPQNAKEHVYQNAYNAYWTSNFAHPDWDMFQTHDPNGEYHAAARALSGGPVYFTDEPGKERPELLRRLVFSDGRLLMLDGPGLVTRDEVLTDVALEPVALKVFGRISRPGTSAGMVAAFNVNKSVHDVAGALSAADVEGLAGSRGAAPPRVAVYRRSSGQVTLLDTRHPTLPFSLGEFGFDLFTLVPVDQGAAVFGLLDKYLGPAAITSQSRPRGQVLVRLREAGDFGAWLDRPPARVEIDGRGLPPPAYSYSRGLLRVPQSSFGNRAGEIELRILLASR